MKIELKVNNKTFKESNLYRQSCSLVIMISMVASDVALIFLLMNNINFSKWILMYFIFTIFKGVWILERGVKDKI